MSVFENGNCASCNEPVQGYSSINGKVYCHSDERHCYQIALWKLRERNRKEMSKELIEQAIERLKELKEKSTPGPWYVDVEDYSIWTGGETVLGGTVCFVNTDQQTGSHKPKGDAELIVTLHRTIDAQMDILRWGKALIEASGDNALGLPVEYVIRLAKAILGVSKW